MVSIHDGKLLLLLPLNHNQREGGVGDDAVQFRYRVIIIIIINEIWPFDESIFDFRWTTTRCLHLAMANRTGAAHGRWLKRIALWIIICVGMRPAGARNWNCIINNGPVATAAAAVAAGGDWWVRPIGLWYHNYWFAIDPTPVLPLPDLIGGYSLQINRPWHVSNATTAERMK